MQASSCVYSLLLAVVVLSRSEDVDEMLTRRCLHGSGKWPVQVKGCHISGSFTKFLLPFLSASWSVVKT